MVGAGWRDRNDPPWSMRIYALMMTAALPVTALAAPVVTASLVPSAFAAAPFAMGQADCSGGSAITAGRAALHAPRGRTPAVSANSVLNGNGELYGRALSVLTSQGRGINVSLPPESFVAPTAGSLTVYTTALPGRGSQVRAIDLETGCDILLATSPEAVRSA